MNTHPKSSGRPCIEPIRLESLFQGAENVEIEIGTGKGAYVLDRATANPGWGFLAFEIKSRLVELVRKRASARGISNLVVMRADARLALEAVQPCSHVSLVTMHFPDPWWKRKHAKRAVAGNATLDEIVRLLRPGGRLFIQTDVFARAAALLRELTDDGRLVNTDPGGGLIGASPLGSRSNRERVCEESGRPVLRLMFEKPREHG